MREIRGGVFQGRFHNLLISKNNTFWASQISGITFQVVRYNRAQAPDEQVVHIPQGSSREHRPDLNQGRLELVVEHQAGIPLLMKPLRGNSSDSTVCGQVVSDPMAQLPTPSHATYLVADRALYNAENLHKLAATGLPWITRVPATLREAQEVLAQAQPATMASRSEGYRSAGVASRYGGGAQRWVLIYSDHRQPQAQRTVDTQGRQQSDQEVRAFKTLCRTALACAADAQQARTRFGAGLQTTFLHDSTVSSTPPMGSADAQALGPSPPRSSTILRGPWHRGSPTVGLASTSRAVLSWRRTPWTRGR
jgi:hypothetical protein